jgi:hypothetical protein
MLSPFDCLKPEYRRVSSATSAHGLTLMTPNIADIATTSVSLFDPFSTAG